MNKASVAQSEQKSRWELEREDKLREQYQEDPAIWLLERFRGVAKITEEQRDRQIREAKIFAQNVAESSERRFAALRDLLISIVAFVAIIALASAGIWIGVAAVAVIFVAVICTNYWRCKKTEALDRFRRRFSELFSKMENFRLDGMLDEDKAFLRKYEDSILFPLAVPADQRDKPDATDLHHIQTLDWAYMHVMGCGHYPETLPDCGDCAAWRVRKNIEDALSKCQDAVESARLNLVNKIDGTTREGAVFVGDFLEAFRKDFWFSHSLDAEQRAFVDWLCEKDHWTFKQADEIYKLCARDKDILGRWNYDVSDETKTIYNRLEARIHSTSIQHGLEDDWEWYDKASEWLVTHESSLKLLRRIIGRTTTIPMFREFEEQRTRFDIGLDQVFKSLEGYGYDPKLVEREMKIIRKHIGKERQYKDYERDLQAAYAFAATDQGLGSEHALVYDCLQIYGIVLDLGTGLSAVAILFAGTFTHFEVPIRVELIPFFLTSVSFVTYHLANTTKTKLERLRAAGLRVLIASGILSLMWWNPEIPSLSKFLRYVLWVIIGIAAIRYCVFLFRKCLSKA